MLNWHIPNSMLMRVRYEVVKRRSVSNDAAACHYSKRPARRSEWCSKPTAFVLSRGSAFRVGATGTCGDVPALIMITVAVVSYTDCIRSRET